MPSNHNKMLESIRWHSLITLHVKLLVPAFGRNLPSSTVKKKYNSLDVLATIVAKDPSLHLRFVLKI